jgi:hypothetical protein
MRVRHSQKIVAHDQFNIVERSARELGVRFRSTDIPASIAPNDLAGNP